MAVIVVVCRDVLIWQIMLMTYSIVAAVILNGFLEPFETKFKLNLE